MRPKRTVTGVVLIIGAVLALTGCAADEPDPLDVVQSIRITGIEDNTNTGWYTVDAGTLTQNGLGVTLTLEFTITHANGVTFDPVSEIQLETGEEITCQADDLRRLPSLVDSTDDWDFACDAASLPEDPEVESMTVTDDYH